MASDKVLSAAERATATEPTYDAAISFLASDVALAQDLADRLSEGLKVFFYPRAQEELAGTDGLESMPEPFRDARVVVILYRGGWGKTRWTRVEEEAIKARTFNDRWNSLIVVQLENDNKKPSWVSETHIRFLFEEFGIEELVGAIKARVKELGGRIAPLTAIEKAKRVRLEADYLADRQALLRDRNFIVGTVHASIQETIAELIALAIKVKSELGFPIVGGPHSSMRSCVLRYEYVSLAVFWKQPISNLLEDFQGEKCFLGAQEFSGFVQIPGENAWFAHPPQKLKLHEFKADVAPDRSLIWVEVGKKPRVPPAQLADRIMQIFLDLISRANQGKVDRPFL